MRTAHVTSFDDLPTAVAELGLPSPRPVLALIGGAGRMAETDLSELFSATIAATVRQAGALAVDGGTDSGVMRLMGRARDDFPLVGVAVEALVEPAGDVPLEPHHTHRVLVPGSSWGEDARYLARVATLLSAGAPAVTVLVNGGEIAYDDCFLSIAEKRPVVVLSGTGRVADEIAAAASGQASDRASGRDSRAVELAHSPWVRVEQATDRRAVAACLLGHLTG